VNLWGRREEKRREEKRREEMREIEGCEKGDGGGRVGGCREQTLFNNRNTCAESVLSFSSNFTISSFTFATPASIPVMLSPLSV
jgi:hypothetical protein